MNRLTIHIIPRKKNTNNPSGKPSAASFLLPYSSYSYFYFFTIKIYMYAVLHRVTMDSAVR